ncbi:MAG: protease modulator HflC [Clostridia bacterium]|nr:protease modulator HflC [Clostridia bacterium]
MKKKIDTIEKENASISREPREKSSIGMRFLKVFIALIMVVAITYFGFTFEVREGSCAVVLRFGAPRAEITESGLYFRLPWPFENVVQYENRMQYLESNAQETVTKDKRNIILTSYVVWQVEDPLLFHNSVGAYGSTETYIDQQVRSATQSTLGTYELTELVSLDKETIKTEEIQQKIFDKVKANCEQNYGISIIDVSILRLSLPDINLQSVFDQMRQDRQTDIDTILAEAEKTASQIQSDAEVRAEEIIAQGTNEAAKIKAETEKAVAQIYAEAHAANLDLFTFLKSLDTLATSVNSGTVLILSTDSYPFNALEDYADMLKDEGDETIVKDLSYILTQLNDTDRQALIDAIGQLLTEAQKGNVQ